MCILLLICCAIANMMCSYACVSVHCVYVWCLYSAVKCPLLVHFPWKEEFWRRLILCLQNPFIANNDTVKVRIQRDTVSILKDWYSERIYKISNTLLKIGRKVRVKSRRIQGPDIVKMFCDPNSFTIRRFHCYHPFLLNIPHVFQGMLELSAILFVHSNPSFHF